MQQASLTIEIKNQQPIELLDLTWSLVGLSEEIKRFVDAHEPEASPTYAGISIRDIRAGSVVADLIVTAPFTPGVSHINTVAKFGAHLQAAYAYLSSSATAKPALEKATYQNLSNIVEPIAKDAGAQLNITAPGGNVVININSVNANAVQNKARKEIERLAEPVSALHEKVLLYWYQARGDVASQKGDKAIIESIDPRPKKIICANDAIKSQMIFDNENPFKWAYVVDVMVETIGNRPVAYKIITLHEKFERGEVA